MPQGHASCARIDALQRREKHSLQAMSSALVCYVSQKRVLKLQWLSFMGFSMQMARLYPYHALSVSMKISYQLITTRHGKQGVQHATVLFWPLD